MCLILIVLSLQIGLSSNLNVPNLLIKALLKNSLVNLSRTSISKNQYVVVPMRAKGNILTKSLGAPSLLAQQAKEYLERNLVGSSLPLKIDNSLLPTLVLALALWSLLSCHSSLSITASSLSAILLGVLGLGSNEELC